jgi:Fur family ferric uptake transcriptional regulator
VLEILSNGGHHDVDEIATQVRRRLDSVSTQAVYDVLGALSRAGLARRIEPAGSPARYEGRTNDNHHHVVCRGCGEIADVDCVIGEAPCLDPSSAHGFVVDEAEVTFWGLCPVCQQTQD